MNITLRFLLFVALLVITAHRLPAPIQEVPESAKPAPEEQDRPKKSSTKAKAKPTESETTAKTQAHSSSTGTPALQGTAKFAGTWTGTIGQPMGAAKVSLLFNATATSVTLAGRARSTTLEGDAISWKSGLMDGNVWTLTPKSDGKTAHVTLRGGMGGEWSATFNRDQGSQTSKKKPGP